MESDEVPITECENLAASASIEVFRRSDTLSTCREMAKILEGMTVSDVRDFSIVAFMLSAKGYKERNYPKITRELVDIIRLRGHFNLRSKWAGTLDVIFRSWTAFHGLVSPADVQLFLRGAGPQASKALSDEGLVTIISMIKNQRQRGED